MSEERWDLDPNNTYTCVFQRSHASMIGKAFDTPPPVSSFMPLQWSLASMSEERRGYQQGFDQQAIELQWSLASMIEESQMARMMPSTARTLQWSLASQ